MSGTGVSFQSCVYVSPMSGVDVRCVHILLFFSHISVPHNGAKPQAIDAIASKHPPLEKDENVYAGSFIRVAILSDSICRDSRSCTLASATMQLIASAAVMQVLIAILSACISLLIGVMPRLILSCLAWSAMRVLIVSSDTPGHSGAGHCWASCHSPSCCVSSYGSSYLSTKLRSSYSCLSSSLAWNPQSLAYLLLPPIAFWLHCVHLSQELVKRTPRPLVLPPL